MNEILEKFAEDLRGRRVQLALGGLGAGLLALFLIGEPWFGVSAWVVTGLVGASIGLFAASWIHSIAAGAE